MTGVQKGMAFSMALDGLRLSRTAPFCLLVGVCAGCGSDGRRNDRDGVLADIGDNEGGFLVAGATPEFDVSSDDRDELVFELAVGATKLSDGTVVVADGWGSDLKFFHPDGRLRQVVGWEGHGPGEFQAISWLGQCGCDSIFVWDRTLQRSTVFDAAGTRVREYAVQANPDGVNAPTFLSCSRNGLQAVLGTPRALPVTAAARARPLTGPLSVLDMTGSSVLNPGDISLGIAEPLGSLTRVAISGALFYVGTAESAFVDAYNLAGSHAGTIEVSRASMRPVTDHHFEVAIDGLLTVFKDRDARADTRRFMLGQPRTIEYLPPYSAIFTDPNNNLWVVLSIPGDTATVLRSFDTSGTSIGGLTIPLEMTVFEVGNDYLLGAYMDDDADVQHVVSIHFEPTGLATH